MHSSQMTPRSLSRICRIDARRALQSRFKRSRLPLRALQPNCKCARQLSFLATRPVAVEICARHGVAQTHVMDLVEDHPLDLAHELMPAVEHVAQDLGRHYKARGVDIHVDIARHQPDIAREGGRELAEPAWNARRDISDATKWCDMHALTFGWTAP